MNITQIKIRKISNGTNLLAIVSITLEEQFAVHDIKIIKKENRLFVAMPNKKMEAYHFQDIVHPIQKEYRQYLEEKIITAYNDLIQSGLDEMSRTLT